MLMATPPETPSAEVPPEQKQQECSAVLAAEKRKQEVDALFTKTGSKELLRGVGIFLYVAGFVVLSAATTNPYHNAPLILGSLTVIFGWGLRRIKTDQTEERKAIPAKSWLLLGLMLVSLLFGVLIQLGVFVPQDKRLMEAVKNHDLNAATKLIGTGANVNYWDKTTGGTALDWAAGNDDLAMLKFLLENGADPNLSSPLVYAAIRSNEEMVRQLLETGANVNQQMSDGTKAIIAALMTNPNSPRYSQNVSIAKLLLQKGANPNAAHPGTQFTALSHAVLLQNADLVRLLLEKGATNWNVQNMNGQSALDLAQGPGGRTEIVELLRNAESLK